MHSSTTAFALIRETQSIRIYKNIERTVLIQPQDRIELPTLLPEVIMTHCGLAKLTGTVATSSSLSSRALTTWAINKHSSSAESCVRTATCIHSIRQYLSSW